VISALVTRSVIPGKSFPESVMFSRTKSKSDFERAGTLDYKDSIVKGSVCINFAILPLSKRVQNVLMNLI
jgi:hypothetical protein